jgi:hypothetical protein
LFFSAAEVAFHFFLFSTFPIVPYISILHDFISYNHLRSSLRYDPRSSSYLPVLVQHVSHVFSQQPSLGIHLSLINRSKQHSGRIQSQVLHVCNIYTYIFTPKIAQM